jgi:UDP-galactopyranose mutase
MKETSTTSKAPNNSATRALATAVSFDRPDLVCLSHLRWNFVYQRPQHLLSRAAKDRRVFFFEEPIFHEQGADPLAKIAHLDVSIDHDSGVHVVVPQLPQGLSHDEVIASQKMLIDDLFSEYNIQQPTVWYYTPMAQKFAEHIDAGCTIFDCMDELSAFKFAPQELKELEAKLLERADVVFTGGQSLYEAKKNRHHNVHAFPSSIDYEHFAKARRINHDPHDQAQIPFPRMGFFGVIDERLDIELVKGIAEARPDWQLVMIGPVVKIDENDLPKLPNIHYLGSKSYKELPNYLATWDVAMLPFAKNESTQFISPTKTPEYLAAGKAVVSTSIRDVVRPYGERNMVHIADTVDEFIRAASIAGMDEANTDIRWRENVDAFLSQMSWDRTWGRMSALIDAAIANPQAAKKNAGVGASLTTTPTQAVRMSSDPKQYVS